jgi:hypothetical protein
MSLFYGDWDRLQDLIMLATILLAMGVLVAALTSRMRSHHHPGPRSA